MEETRGAREDGSSSEAARLAKQICEGFIAHDRGDRQGAIAAFSAVDERQFDHVSVENRRMAAEALVDALWEKDDLEAGHYTGGTLNAETLRKADWGSVRRKFRERASLLELDNEYAVLKTRAWRRHKTGGDYWTPFQQAQVHELRVATDDPNYPSKPKWGTSGFGPEPARYALAVELHDMHDASYWQQAQDVMTPYFERVLDDTGGVSGR